MISGSMIVILLGICVLCWLLFYLIPLPPFWKNVFAVVLAVGILLWILNLMGVIAF